MESIENSKKFDSTDFQLAQKTLSIQKLSRPSLSYWQDAWRRLKKNKKAIFSFYLILLILFFTLFGPFVWPVDPGAQNLNYISQGPTFSRQVLVMDEYKSWEGVVDPNILTPPQNALPYSELSATNKVEVVGTPSSLFVRIKWDHVLGASGYSIYRSDVKPPKRKSLGIPLETIPVGNKLSFEDKLKLEPKTYWYSVVATDGTDEANTYTTLQVDVQEAISLGDALKMNPAARVGETIKLTGNPMGTDYLGRDMLARLIYGARVSLFVGIVAPLIYILFGALYGGISGYIGGRTDDWMMRFADFIVALPFLIFMILFKIAFGIGPGESGVFPMLVALVALSWPSAARLVRGEILKLREEGFIQAARLMGAKPFYLLIKHLIPNTMGVLLVTITFAIPSSIFIEAFLSFIGMGVVPPTPSWGSMCNEGVKSILNHPHELLFPSFLISISVLAFNLLGDGLRDATDARMRSRE